LLSEISGEDTCMWHSSNLICGLFYETFVSRLYSTELQNEGWTGRDSEGNCYGLIKVVSRHFPRGTVANHKKNVSESVKFSVA
jgi:hypothetical protein